MEVVAFSEGLPQKVGFSVIVAQDSRPAVIGEFGLGYGAGAASKRSQDQPGEKPRQPKIDSKHPLCPPAFCSHAHITTTVVFVQTFPKQSSSILISDPDSTIETWRDFGLRHSQDSPLK
jgi:hypothetical protein